MKESGLTLIELLLTIAIFLIVGSLSTPFYARFLTQNSTANVADQLVGEMRKAQIYAMMGRQNSPWGVAVNLGSIILFKGDSFSSRDQAFDEKFLLNPNISIGGLTEITFLKTTGLPNLIPTIIISSTGSIKTISVNSQGVVSK